MTALRLCSLFLLLPLSACLGRAATPKEIDEAIKSGSEYLKDQYKGTTTKQVTSGPNGVGAAALAGLALLESGTPASHPSVKAITAAVRDSAFTTRQTYHITLCMLYLDKLGDPTDVPLIQMLGVRLLAGQSGNGGWTYECVESVSLLDERALRASLLNPEAASSFKKPPPNTAINPGKNSGAGSGGKPADVKLHPEVVKYQDKIAAVRVRTGIDDNSNTQFGVLGIWVARKHGLSVETALDLIEKRFLNSQMSGGGWPYVGSLKAGSPSMTCAGLLGLATAVGRREERLKSEAAKTGSPSKVGLGANTNPDEKTAPAKPLPDSLDKAIQKGLSSVGSVLASNAPGAGRGKSTRFLLNGGGALGDRDLYFLWSVERVAVIYGLKQIGGVDWYDVGAEELVAAQNISGSWGRGGCGAEVDTAFAILFLVRSNPALELSNTLQSGFSTTELRSGVGPASPRGTDSTSTGPGSTSTAPSTKPAAQSEPAESRRPGVIVIRPSDSNDEDPKALAADLVKTQGLEWDTMLKKIRDGKGTANTQALVLAIGRLEGDRLTLARDALAERLARMTAETLRTMAKSEEVELRRASILAMAMKDDKSHVPDLIAAILDDQDLVVRAAKAGLKSLTGQDFGPEMPSTSSERKAAAAAWKEWFKEQKKP